MQKIKFIHKISNEIIIEFISNSIKFENSNNIHNIKIGISIDDYNKLKNDNYTVSEDFDTLYEGGLSEIELLKESEKTKKCFFNFNILSMSEEMYYSYITLFHKLAWHEKELMKIGYLDKYNKLENILLYVDDKEVDITTSIMQEQLIYIN